MSVQRHSPPEKGAVHRDAPERLDVLVLDEDLPYPLDTGKRIRTWNLLRRLAQQHNVTLLCRGTPGEHSAHIEAEGIRVRLVPPLPVWSGWRLYLRLLGNLFSLLPYSVAKHYTRDFRRELSAVLRQQQFDLVHCEWTPYAAYLPAARDVRQLIATHNVESQIWWRRWAHSQTVMERIFFALQAWKMKRFECRVLRSADQVTAVSEPDAAQLHSWGIGGVSVVENGVDLNNFAPPEATYGDDDEVLFLGSLDWYPNEEAVCWLLREVWPRIQAQRPQTRLRIVGRRPTADLKSALALQRGVELNADVADVRPYLGRAAVVVVPLHIGGGSRIKILEGLAMGRAVLSTSIGAEGLTVVDGVHLHLADTSQLFAARLLELLDSPAERQQLGANGRQLVRERYGWDRIARVLDGVWRDGRTERTNVPQPSSVAQEPMRCSG